MQSSQEHAWGANPGAAAVPYRCDVQMFPGVSGETILKKIGKWHFGRGVESLRGHAEGNLTTFPIHHSECSADQSQGDNNAFGTKNINLYPEHFNK